ncbi:winged helix-turn-helix transcriptional regulator [Allostreptomyces psammosilenae]|uniref:DNA-binding HxlR family transcriptional regulator n=1 Tax=Allostreptomyces psammosilenae TaxID=1892865 RepID=A0A852ZQB3_9ACTN|nr:helix-turn-helix domain-containing protein [Allostreptomyces psammosilenae]NYI03460.1 DNA-binding HxlR family transcriptional regulator [Allostreptomyces psammosilenae]
MTAQPSPPPPSARRDESAPRPRLVPPPTAGGDQDDRCPCRPLLDRLGDRWSALALAILEEGPEYHGELRRRMGEVSRKVLTQTLRALERDGLVSRTVVQGPVVRVRYALTPLGHTLAAPLVAIRDWTAHHQAAVDQARRAYDARPAEPGVTRLREEAAVARGWGAGA